MVTNRTKLTPAAGGVAYNPGDLFHMPNQGDYGQRQRDYHVGIDYAAKAGTSIPAASSGEVVYSGPSGGFHHAVVVKSIGRDGRAYYSIYGHVDPQGALPPGAKVSAGETIGAVGTTHPGEGELSGGPHEHFGIVTQDAIDAYNRKYGTRISVAPNGGESGGLGFRTGQTELFENPDEFTNYADGAPYNTRTYIPIRDGLASRSVPNLAQSQDADQPLSQRNPANRAGLSPVELNRFYTDTGNHAPDQLASIVDGTSRVAIPNGASGSAASGFPRDNIPTPNLYLDGMKAARPLFGMVPPSNAPLNPVHAIPDGTANPATPNSPAPQSNRRSALPDGVTSILAQAASPSGVAFAPSGPNAPASLFSRLMSAGPDAFLAADDTASPPSQARATQNVADNRPMRFLVGRTYDPSQGSPFKAQPAPAPASPDGSLSLDDAYLEYLKRLNAA